jgi:tRNA-dihydrouridine synthase
MVALLL